MSQRQERYCGGATIVQLRGDTIFGIAGDVAACYHHTLAVAGGARCVVENHHIVIGNISISNIGSGEPVGISLAEQFVAIRHHLGYVLAFFLGKHLACLNRHHSTNVMQGIEVDGVPNCFGRKQYHSLRVVDYMLHIKRIEFLQNRHNGCAISHCRNHHSHPSAGVFAYQRNLVALLDAQITVNFVHQRYLTGKFEICECIVCAIIRQCRQLGVLSERLLVDFNYVFSHDSSF